MDNKVNYTLVGLFVFCFGLVLIAFLLWMAKYGLEEKQHDAYTILMQDSVSGLNIESPVKFRGVEVGQVGAITIDHQNSEIIRVSIEVLPETPIKQDSFAVLTAQGITGLSYIELKGGSRESPRLSAGGIIPAGKSLFDKIEYSATHVTESIVHTLKKVDAMLSEENVRSLSNLLAHLEKVSATLAEQTPQALSNENIENIRLTLANVASSSERLAQTFEQVLNDENARRINQTLAHLVQTSAQIDRESHKMGKLLDRGIVLENQAEKTLSDFSNLSVLIQEKINQGEFDLRQMTEHHLEALNNLLVELQMLSHQTNEVLRQLKRSPSDLLFKQEQVKPGPGE